MIFSEDELRTMIRDAIARHSAERAGTPVMAVLQTQLDHASLARFAVSAGGDADGQCIIEPSVRCTHCGFCQSYGH